MARKKNLQSYKLMKETGEICFDGEKLEYEGFVYYAMNKPQGVISATEDPKRKTVLGFNG